MYCMFMAFEIGSHSERTQADVADVAEIVLAIVVFSAGIELVWVWSIIEDILRWSRQGEYVLLLAWGVEHLPTVSADGFVV